MMQPRRIFLAALVAGATSAFAFQPVGWWPLMIVSIAVLCELTARAGSLRHALLAGWGFGFGQFVIALNWIATSFTYQAAMPAWLGWAAVPLVSLYLAVYPMLATGLAWRFGQKSRVALVLALAGSWAISEWLRATMFTGFAWNPAAVVLVDTPALHSIGWLGTYGLSALVIGAGGGLWLAYRRRFRSATAVAAALVVACLIPPVELARQAAPRPIRVVQPNIGQDIKWDEQSAALAQAKLDRLTTIRNARDELIFWPEAAVTTPLSDNRPPAAPLVVDERLAATRALEGRDLLVTGGLALRSSNGRQADAAANSVFVLAPQGRFVGRYDKAHLVPYGEYLPLRPLLSLVGLSRLVPGSVDFQPGPGPGSLTLPEGWGTVGFQLCYEIIFSGEVVSRDNRPDFIFNPSNDAWFGAWGPPQHLAQARLRAAEEGIPVIRSTPTGISAIVDAHGTIVDSIPWRKAGVIWSYLPSPAARLTPFARLGNIIPLALGFILLIAAIALDGRRRYRQT
jgi:apolipoprotein N-acyltransferase